MSLRGAVVGAVLDVLSPRLLDPDCVRLVARNERGVAAVRRACSKELNTVHQLVREIYRNDLLCGALDYTKNEKIEHLIVGLGKRSGRNTIVTHLMHVRGLECEVRLTPQIITAIENHLMAEHKTEIILFHNHSQNSMHALLDNLPIASAVDRVLLQTMRFHPRQIIREATNGGRVLFYLGENGFVCEFRTPSFGQFIPH